MEEQRVKERIAREHMDLIGRMVGAMFRRFGGQVPKDELRSYALEGLAQAIDRFDADKNESFGMFASFRIRYSIYDGLAESDMLPRRLKRKIAFFRKADELLAARASEPSPDDRVESAHRLAKSLKELSTVYVTSCALDEESAAVSTPAEAEYEMDRRRFGNQLTTHLSALPENQRTVLRHYFYEERTLEEIGGLCGHTKSWASRVLRTGLVSLREVLEEHPPTLEAYQPHV